MLLNTLHIGIMLNIQRTTGPNIDYYTHWSILCVFSMLILNGVNFNNCDCLKFFLVHFLNFTFYDKTRNCRLQELKLRPPDFVYTEIVCIAWCFQEIQKKMMLVEFEDKRNIMMIGLLNFRKTLNKTIIRLGTYSSHYV